MNFPFHDQPNTMTLVCCHVLDKTSPILYVTHDADNGMWQFLCGKKHVDDEARIISLQSAFELDPSVGILSDMPCGYCAYRETPTSLWQISQLS